jgi:hypothetical protein
VGCPAYLNPTRLPTGPWGARLFSRERGSPPGASFRSGARRDLQRGGGWELNTRCRYHTRSTPHAACVATRRVISRTKGQRVSIFFFSKTSHPTRLDALCATEYDCENAIRFVAQLEQFG